MKFLKSFVTICLFLTSMYASADNYNLAVNWLDTTPTGPDYTPVYNIEYQVGTAPVIAVNDQVAPAYTTSIVTSPSTIVKVRVQNKNTKGPLVSAWSTWVNATAQNPPTTPSNPSGITFTLTRLP